ncbi:hypothetical protein C3L33_10027, partial [Rhododendron williamsianum]
MGTAGRLVRDKGHPLLHQAFSEISKRQPNVFLLVAGSGPWGKRYAELGPTVKILGPLEANELSEFYNAIDVFVNPTLRPQGLDLTLIEAMHCGKPVLTPNFPSITGTVVLNEGFGYTFAPNVKSLVEAMETAIADGVEVLERKGGVCKEYVGSMFTADKMASAYERSSTILTITLFLASTIYFFFAPARQWHYPDHLAWAVPAAPFAGDLRDARFPWNKLSYGPASL